MNCRSRFLRFFIGSMIVLAWIWWFSIRMTSGIAVELVERFEFRLEMRAASFRFSADLNDPQWPCYDAFTFGLLPMRSGGGYSNPFGEFGATRAYSGIVGAAVIVPVWFPWLVLNGVAFAFCSFTFAGTLAAMERDLAEEAAVKDKEVVRRYLQ